MKNLAIVFNVILAIAVGFLYYLHFKTTDVCNKQAKSVGKDSLSATTMPIAYINVDSLLSNYSFAKDANEKLLSKGESSRATLNQKAKQLQGEMVEFQRKVQNNAFLSRDRAEKEQLRLMKAQKDLEDLDKKLTQDLMTEQQKMNEQLRDTINLFLKEYQKGKHLQVIFSNTMNDNIFYATSSYDITPDVVKQLNTRYVKK